MSEEQVRRTGIGHDDDGNVDDKRVAAWVMLAVATGMGVYAITLSEAGAATELVQAFLLAGVGLMAPTVAEKFKRKGA